MSIEARLGYRARSVASATPPGRSRCLRRATHLPAVDGGLGHVPVEPGGSHQPRHGPAGEGPGALQLRPPSVSGRRQRPKCCNPGLMIVVGLFILVSRGDRRTSWRLRDCSAAPLLPPHLRHIVIERQRVNRLSSSASSAGPRHVRSGSVSGPLLTRCVRPTVSPTRSTHWRRSPYRTHLRGSRRFSPRPLARVRSPIR